MAQNNVSKYKMVVIGGSAGALEIVLGITAQLPPQSQCTFVIVLHRKTGMESLLTNLVMAKTTLPVIEIEDKENIRPGTIYLAPPDYHLLFERDETFSLDSSEKINFSRPSIDVTFESAAEIYGSAVIGVLLSGANADGAEGLRKIKLSGGCTIVQNPQTADVSFMPQQALLKTKADAVVDGENIGELISKMIRMK
ncbi:MAG: chemotaxis protein CheB [Bacteroidota bacterium]